MFNFNYILQDINKIYKQYLCTINLKDIRIWNQELKNY